MSLVVDVLASILILSGAVIAVIAAVGLHTCRTSTRGCTSPRSPRPSGSRSASPARALLADSTSMVTKLVLAIVFQLVTTPAAGHLLGRAAHSANAPVSEYTFVDELRSLPGSHRRRHRADLVPPRTDRPERTSKP